MISNFCHQKKIIHPLWSTYREFNKNSLAEAERIRTQNFHSYSVKEDEYEFLSELHE